MEQTNLRRRRTSARLAFADHVDRFLAGQRSPGSPKRTKTLIGVNPSLDGPVVLLQDIVEVRHRPVLAAGVQRSFALELSDHGRVSRMPIGVDDTRRGMVLLTQGFGQEALCCGRVLLCREQEVEGGAGGVKSPIKITPLAFDPDVSFVHPPTVRGLFEPRAQTSFHFRGIPLDPPPDGDVVDQKSALGKQLFDVPVRKREAQIPADSEEDYLRFELPPFEKTRNRRHEQEHRPSLPRGDCKVATLPPVAYSLTTSFASLSVRRPRKTGCRS